jgi:hypothetical protein
MQSFIASDVDVPDETSLDYGEGCPLRFSWPDALYGCEGLTIDLEGHCSRNMPIRSGYGLKSVDLHRDRILISFKASLAQQLELDDNIEIGFQISDADFERLQRTVAEHLLPYSVETD